MRAGEGRGLLLFSSDSYSLAVLAIALGMSFLLIKKGFGISPKPLIFGW